MIPQSLNPQERDYGSYCCTILSFFNCRLGIRIIDAINGIFINLNKLIHSIKKTKNIILIEY